MEEMQEATFTPAISRMAKEICRPRNMSTWERLSNGYSNQKQMLEAKKLVCAHFGDQGYVFEGKGERLKDFRQNANRLRREGVAPVMDAPISRALTTEATRAGGLCDLRPNILIRNLVPDPKAGG